MLGIAAKQPIELRGTLMRDGQPLTAEDLELMTGFSSKIFSAAFAFFAQPRQGWLVKCDPQADGTKMFSVEHKCSALNKNVPTLQDRRGEDRTGDDMTVEQNAAGAAPAVVSGLGLVFTTDEAERIVAAEAKSKRDAAELLAAQRAAAEAAHAAAEAEAARLKSAADANWLDGLKRNPAYEGIDVMREHAKAAVWCENKRRTLSRARFINWLNRAERPMAGRSTMR